MGEAEATVPVRPLTGYHGSRGPAGKSRSAWAFCESVDTGDLVPTATRRSQVPFALVCRQNVLRRGRKSTGGISGAASGHSTFRHCTDGHGLIDWRTIGCPSKSAVLMRFRTSDAYYNPLLAMLLSREETSELLEPPSRCCVGLFDGPEVNTPLRNSLDGTCSGAGDKCYRA